MSTPGPSAVERVQAALARIAAWEPRLQAFSQLDPQRALDHARALDARRSAGGGSVRWPAALRGVVGYKASATPSPCDGVFPLSPELDSIGLFTPSARDARVVHAALTGVRLVAAETPEAAEIDAVFRGLVPADLLAFLGRERVAAQFDRLDAVAAGRLQAVFELRADDYARMLARRRATQRSVAERSVGIDGWLSPTVPMVPEPTARFRTVDDVAAWNQRATRNTRPGNLFGQCAISLPIQHLGAASAARAGGGALPVGLQLSAAPGPDAAMRAMACAIEDLLGRPAASMPATPPG